MSKIQRLLIVIIFFLIGCGTKVVVQHVKDKPITKDGVYYALPKSVVIVKMPIKRITKTKGDQAQCIKYLDRVGFTEGEVKAIKDQDKKFDELPEGPREFVSFELGKPEISTIGVPDTDNIYLVEVDGGFLKKQNTLLKLTETGLITNFDITVTDQSLDLAIKTLEVGASIVSKVLTFGVLKAENGQCDNILNRIKEVEDARMSLLTSKAIVTNEATFNLLLKKLDENLTRYLNAIRGTTTAVEWTVTFRYIPEKNIKRNKEISKEIIEHKQVLFEIPDKCKLSIITGQDDIPVPGIFAKETKTSRHCEEGKSIISLVIARQSTGFADIVEQNSLKDSPEHGVRYRIPAEASAKIIKHNVSSSGSGYKESTTLIATNKLQISQFGTVVALPPSTGPGETGYKIEFYTDTGSLKSLGATSATISPETIGKLGTAVEKVIDTARTREKEKLTLERDELKLQLEIEELKDKLKDIQQ